MQSIGLILQSRQKQYRDLVNRVGVKPTENKPKDWYQMVKMVNDLDLDLTTEAIRGFDDCKVNELKDGVIRYEITVDNGKLEKSNYVINLVAYELDGVTIKAHIFGAVSSSNTCYIRDLVGSYDKKIDVKNGAKSIL